MKTFRIPILIVAALGLVTLFLPNGEGASMFSVFLEFDRFRLALMLAAFALPLVAVMAALRAATPQSWHGIMALSGFALATVKAQIWLVVQHFGDVYMPMKLQTAAIIAGVILSIFAVAKEDRPTS